MAKTIDQRLSDLSNRRARIPGTMAVDQAAISEATRLAYSGEAWQRRATNRPYTRYALGAMAEVSETYTRVSLETAYRVANQLHKRITVSPVEFRIQGSVALNVHIRSVSDVDLLTLIHGNTHLTADRAGVRAQQGQYNWHDDKSEDLLRALRRDIEHELPDAFPQAQVDSTGRKAVKISGATLARAVDVVPSHWDDNVNYQQSQQEHERGVVIYDKPTHSTIKNWPFIHIKRVSDRDIACQGGLRKIIRLAKNIKADADAEISFPSFDLAAFFYHANQGALATSAFLELSALGEAQRHAAYYAQRRDEAKSLFVPDGSRAVFDTPEKLTALGQLSDEITDLAINVALENGLSTGATSEQIREKLFSTHVAE